MRAGVAIGVWTVLVGACSTATPAVRPAPAVVAALESAPKATPTESKTVCVLCPLMALRGPEWPGCPTGLIEKRFPGGYRHCETAEGRYHGYSWAVDSKGVTILLWIEDGGEYGVVGIWEGKSLRRLWFRKHGQWDGPQVHFQKHAVEVETYRDGRRHGPVVRTGWNGPWRKEKDGQLAEEGQFKDGYKHGVWQRFERGQVGENVGYYENRRHGLRWWFDGTDYHLEDYVRGRVSEVLKASPIPPAEAYEFEE